MLWQPTEFDKFFTYVFIIEPFSEKGNGSIFACMAVC